MSDDPATELIDEQKQVCSAICARSGEPACWHGLVDDADFYPCTACQIAADRIVSIRHELTPAASIYKWYPPAYSIDERIVYFKLGEVRTGTVKRVRTEHIWHEAHGEQATAVCTHFYNLHEGDRIDENIPEQNTMGLA